MSCPDFIQIHYQNDQRLRIVSAGKEFFSRYDDVPELERLLRATVGSALAVKIFLQDQHVVVSQATIPVTFNEEDILQFIHIEQAKLFPMLEQEIYVDFMVSSLDQEHQHLVIVACSCRYFSRLFVMLEALSLSILGLFFIKDKSVALNLLPWRQVEKNKRYKQLCKKIFLFYGLAFVIFFIVSVIFISRAIHDNKKNRDIGQKIEQQQKALSELEKINHAYQQLLQEWRFGINNARIQLGLEKKLIWIDELRPAELVVDKIMFQDNELLVYGRSPIEKSFSLYIERLKNLDLSVNVRSLKNIDHHGNEFEIAISGDA